MNRKRISIILLFAFIFLGVVVSHAQDTPILISVDQNQAGELTASQTSISYVLGVTQPQLITIQVLGLSANFFPTFTISDPAGLNIFSANNSTLSIVSATQAFINPGAYRIVVSSGNGQFGQFVISLQGGGALQPPQAISAGQVIEGTVSAEAQLLMYSFSASQRDNLRLSVRSNLSNVGPSVLLQDATTGETLGMSNGRLIGAEFRIPATLVTMNYRVQISYNPNGGAEQSYTLCLVSETAPSTCPGGTTAAATPPSLPSPTPQPATLVPLSSTGQCVIAPSGNQNVNVRSQPNTSASVLGQLPSNTTLPVTGKLGDSSWYQVSYNGVQGWISASVVRLGGQCGSVPVVNPTSSGSTSPTLAPVSTLPPAVVATTAAPSLTLNFSLAPNYGSTALTSGFVPDPFSISITSGGNVNVSYLGAGCRGFATSAPDYSVTYTSGSFPLLRFYFVGSGDTTMIINNPSGGYNCADDSYSTLNPTIDYNSPASGRYDIWIGSFQQGTNVSGTLYVTENNGNHP